MKKVLYIESTAGISGDMSVAALIDLGASFDEIRRVINSIGIEGFTLSYDRVKKAGLDCGSFSVNLDGAHENHDHDMEYLHGHDNDYAHDHAHDHGHDCCHEHNDHHDHNKDHGHHHEHRSLSDVSGIIDGADTSAEVKDLAKKIFGIVAQAESTAHGVPVSEVHFHEVGAVDSIADILAFSVAFRELGITDVIVPYLTEGRGTVRCQHGILPVPVPATSNIIAAENMPLHIMNTEGEFVTPTGAAIACAVCTSHELPDTFRIKKTGIGAGKRNYERPGILRMMIIEDESYTANTDDSLDIGYVYKLETNIDDATGESLGLCMELLMQAGAYDVHFVPVYMKKNRPGVVLYVICSEESLPEMERIIYLNTTTIGIRRLRMERSCLNRRSDVRNTSLGEVRVKVCELYGEESIYPEYESLRDICEKRGLGYTEVYKKVLQEI